MTRERKIFLILNLSYKILSYKSKDKQIMGKIFNLEMCLAN